MTKSLAASAAALAPAGPPAAGGGFFELRRYTLTTGAQTQAPSLLDSYLGQALLPAANRAGITPIGAFALNYGPETPSTYVLLPSPRLETLLELPTRLAQDAAYQKAAAAFLSAPAATPAFVRMDTQLLRAFDYFAFPPAAHTGSGARIFQLRTYESPTPATHERKVEMFQTGGEFDIFKRTGLNAVFFGETLIGPRMPSLTYMLTFKSLAELEANWHTFSSDPAWIKLKADPHYASEPLVSNITNLVLSPHPYSQI